MTNAVRAALHAWKDAIDNRDIDGFIAMYSESFTDPEDGGALDQLRTSYERVFADPRKQALIHDISCAEISVDGDRAVAEPVHVTDLHSCLLTRIVFVNEDGAWKIREASVRDRKPVEYAMPGHGSGYVKTLESWTSGQLTWIRETLRANPPASGDLALRRHAISALDEPLHLRSAPLLDSVRDYLRGGIDDVLTQIRGETITDGVVIWKLYNHGWIVKSAEQTWGFDIYEGFGKATMTSEQVDGLLDQIDVLSCSHWHRDHASPPVIKRALEMDIPVLLPPLPGGELGKYLGREFRGAEHIWGEGSGEAGGIPYHVYQGHQDHRPNNVFVANVGGTKVMQSGDQWNPDDYEWIDRVGVEHDVDVLLTWMADLQRITQGVRPRVVIPGHENELGHLFEHREPYDQAYERTEQVDCETYVLAWGERVAIPTA
jgi:L-ascorbate metabolism protein UlaG (beta-lactamase superfamily)